MKKLIVIVSFILLFGCNGATNVLKCKMSVVEHFPNNKGVFKPTNKRFMWIVVDSSGGIWYVETDEFNSPNVSEKELIFNLSDVSE